jgi:membrane dipeptidase
MLKSFFLICLAFNLHAFAQPSERFHQKAIVTDTHNDVLSVIVQKGFNLGDDLKNQTHTDLSRLKQGGVDIQVFSIFCDERYGKGTAFKYAIREMDTLKQVAYRNQDKIVLVHNFRELKKVNRAGKIAALTGIEGGHMIEENLAYLDSFYKRGARYMTLTWNNSVPWATSAADESQGKTPFGSKGLTDFGKNVVKRMNQMGMIIDISHVGEQTFQDVVITTEKPVIASHSSVYKLCPHPRNLKDEQIRAIGKNGGVIFINFYSGFLDSNYMHRKRLFLQNHKPEADSLARLNMSLPDVEDFLFKIHSNEAAALRPTIAQLMDHFDYVVKLIGIDHVGLGSDFDGIESAPQGLNGVEDFPKITAALLQRGYSNRDIKKILGGNFLRVFKTAGTSFNTN